MLPTKQARGGGLGVRRCCAANTIDAGPENERIELRGSRTTVVLLVLVLVSTMLLAGCAVHWGPHVHPADATTREGRAFILDQNVRYVDKTLGLFFTDIINWGGVFAIDVVGQETSEDTTSVSYRALNADAVASFGLVPRKSWWAANGRWVFAGLLALIVLGWLAGSLRKKPTPAQVQRSR